MPTCCCSQGVSGRSPELKCGLLPSDHRTLPGDNHGADRFWMVQGAPETSRKPTGGKTHMKKAMKVIQVETWKTNCFLAGTCQHAPGSHKQTGELQELFHDHSNIGMGIFCPKNHSGIKTPFHNTPRTQVDETSHPSKGKKDDQQQKPR